MLPGQRSQAQVVRPNAQVSLLLRLPLEASQALLLSLPIFLPIHLLLFPVPSVTPFLL